MKVLAFFVLVLLALPACAGTTKKERRSGTPAEVPSWIKKELKPIVNKPVVTR